MTLVSMPTVGEDECREAGVLRVEEKSHLIEDGDVVNFRSNV